MPLVSSSKVRQPPFPNPTVGLARSEGEHCSGSHLTERTIFRDNVAGHAAKGDTKSSPEDPTVPNRFLTWLYTLGEKGVSKLARAFHHNMQLAGCAISNLSHDTS